jgi:hypothetical protein
MSRRRYSWDEKRTGNYVRAGRGIGAVPNTRLGSRQRMLEVTVSPGLNGENRPSRGPSIISLAKEVLR